MPTWAKELKPSHGNINRANSTRHGTHTVPTVQDIMDIEAANAGVYLLTESEIKKLRSRVYALNKDNAFRWRWRTLVEPTRSSRYQQLLVWRIH